MAIKKRTKRIKSSQTIFDSGGCKGLEDEEIFSALLGTKRTNYLVFHLDHTEITFGLIVGKRNEGIICKTADVSLVFNKTFNQGTNGAFLRFSSFSLSRKNKYPEVQGKSRVNTAFSYETFGIFF